MLVINLKNRQKDEFKNTKAGTTYMFTKNYLPNPNKKSDVIARSEEVQAIIDRMPTYWAKWVILCVGVLMGMIILLGF